MDTSKTHTLKVDESTILSSPCLSLANDDGGSDLFTELWLSFLYSCQHHVANAARGQAVKTSAGAGDGDDVKVLGTSVIGAVDNSANWQRACDAELVSDRTSRSYDGDGSMQERERERERCRKVVGSCGSSSCCSGWLVGWNEKVVVENQ
jgi:hypothetical protein